MNLGRWVILVQARALVQCSVDRSIAVGVLQLVCSCVKKMGLVFYRRGSAGGLGWCGSSEAVSGAVHSHTRPLVIRVPVASLPLTSSC